MSISDLEQVIAECCNDVVFEYNGKSSGVTSEVKNSNPIFQSWHGDNIKEYTDIDSVMTDCFF